MANQRRSYVDHVTCPICLDLLYNPRALPCMHTFCAECLNSYITCDGKIGDRKGFVCPVCKTFTKPPLKGMLSCSWAYNFPLNFALNGLVNEMKAKHKSRTTMQGEGTDGIAETKCINHPDRVIEFECLDHSESFCSVCAALSHRKCEQINFLGYPGDEGKKPKQNFKSKDDCSQRRKMHRSITRLSKSFDEYDQTVPKSINPEVLTSDFANARSIVESSENDTETIPKVIVDQENATDLARKHLNDDLVPKKENLNESSVLNARKSLARLYFKAEENKNRSTQEIPRSQVSFTGYDKLQNVEAASDVGGMSSLNDIIEEDEDILSVTIDENVSKSYLQVANRFYVRTQCDQKCCSITGMCVLPDGKVVVADEANENVKLFDSNGLFETCIKLETEPWDVTAIEQHEMAVTCPASKNIHVMLTSDSLPIVKTIDLDKRCYGISYYKNDIYVAMENEIRIITYEGKVSMKICSESVKRRLFSFPLSFPRNIFRSAKYIDLKTNQLNVEILVSDSSRNCVASINRQGKILTMLKLNNDDVPYGVSFGNGKTFYVCTAPDMLLAIDSDEHGNRIKNILEMNAMQAVHYDRMSHLLLVSRRAHNFVTVYKVRKDPSS